MKTVFAIGNTEGACDVLLLEIGSDYCCYALLEGRERTFRQIRYLTFDELEMEGQMARILEGLRNQNCTQVVVCSAFPEALLVPASFGGQSRALLDVVYDQPSPQYFRDEVSEWQITASYCLSSSLVDLLKQNFSSVEFLHAYTPALKVFNGFVADSQIDIHFGTQHFRVLVKKAKQVQLAQTYAYKTPLDVVYFLLKICYEFQLDQSEVFLIVSGLIEQDSAMYSELHNYFLNLHFAQAPSFSLPESEHPHHYFTSLYNLAACV